MISQKKIKSFLEKFNDKKEKLTEEKNYLSLKVKQLEKTLNEKNDEFIKLKTRVIEYEKGIFRI